MLNYEFVITPMQVWQFILLICGGIITIGGAISIVKKWIQSAKKPSTEVKDEVTNLKKTVKNYEQFFKNDKEAIEELRKGQRIMYKSQLALISHAIDGNNTKQLEEVEGELQEFLINR